MVYESDFYTTRRPYSRPTVSSYSTTQYGPLRIIPGIGRVHTIHSFYPNTIPYVGHQRITQSRGSYMPYAHTIHNVTVLRPVKVSVRPSVIHRELYRIENRMRSSPSYLPTESYLNSSSAVDFDDEKRSIRAQTESLLRRVNSPVPRPRSLVPFATIQRYELPPRSWAVDLSDILGPIGKVHRDIMSMSQYAEPAKRFTGRGHLASLRYVGNRSFSKRKALSYDDNRSIRSDVNLLSYYLKNRNAARGILELDSDKLNPFRPSRKFTTPKNLEDPKLELKEAKAERQSRFDALSSDKVAKATPGVDLEAERIAKRKKQKQEEARLAEERELAEEQSRRKEQSKRDEAARAAELARQEELAAQAAAERAAELERRAEIARQEEQAAEIAKEAAKKQAAEEQRVREEELARLEEIEKEAEADQARQAAELAEMARQEAELAELARQEAELAELAKQEAELAELAKQEAELAELARQEAEIAELAKQEAELAELAKQEAELAELAKQEAEVAELARQEGELAELAKQEAELAELAKQEAELAALDQQAAELTMADDPAADESADDAAVAESTEGEATPIASPEPADEE